MPDCDREPRRRWAWWLPPALAVLAIALQLAIDVPHHEMLPREVNEPKPPAKTTTAARTPRPWRARGAVYVERLRNSWSSRPIADEPIDPRFAEHHETLLRAIVRKAEAAVTPFEELMHVSARATCHTIRCELEVCAPTPIAAGIAEHLPNFTVGDRALWHELRELESEQRSGGRETCYRYLVDFAVEGADPRNLRLVL
ncbi:MAG: hypothetical protein R6X02_25005 [Enhygromyxa sp.]